MYRAGVASILSQLVRDGRLAVVEQFGVDAPKTKPRAEGEGHGLRLRADHHRYAGRDLLSARNLPHVLVLKRAKPIR